MFSRNSLTRVAVLAMLALPMTVLAQDQGGGGGGNAPAAGGDAGGGRRNGGGGGGGGGGGNFDPAQMRERMMNGIKEEMGATDEEWQVLAPKVEKVMTAQRDARFGGGFGGRRGGGFGGGGGGGNQQQPQSAVGKAAQELRDVLQNKDASADQINAKLTAFREAKKTAQADLEAAQKDLKEMLTARQEAVLVSRNMLD